MQRSTVLIVDDEENVRVTLAAILSEQGYDIQAAASGAEAVALLQKTEFDLVLTDLRMDGVDGLQVLAEARTRWPDSVTIMLTGHASVVSAIAALRVGAYDYLCKPCPTEDMLATVARGVERRRLTRNLKLYVRQLEISIETARELYSVMDARLLEATTTLRDREEELAALRAGRSMPLLGEAADQRVAGWVEAEAGTMTGPASVRSTRYETVEIAEGQHSGSVAV